MLVRHGSSHLYCYAVLMRSPWRHDINSGCTAYNFCIPAVPAGNPHREREPSSLPYYLLGLNVRSHKPIRWQFSRQVGIYHYFHPVL